MEKIPGCRRRVPTRTLPASHTVLPASHPVLPATHRLATPAPRAARPPGSGSVSATVCLPRGASRPQMCRRRSPEKMQDAVQASRELRRELERGDVAVIRGAGHGAGSVLRVCGRPLRCPIPARSNCQNTPRPHRPPLRRVRFRCLGAKAWRVTRRALDPARVSPAGRTNGSNSGGAHSRGLGSGRSMARSGLAVRRTKAGEPHAPALLPPNGARGAPPTRSGSPQPRLPTLPCMVPTPGVVDPRRPRRCAKEGQMRRDLRAPPGLRSPPAGRTGSRTPPAPPRPRSVRVARGIIPHRFSGREHARERGACDGRA
ncbi:hypothetical protein DFJ74DRAFT_692011 [Hyaloraphidium curvatum]|nr:hypothetical protein DFJ74DRAFT_692011 [Hyaloraphidium curvatum]